MKRLITFVTRPHLSMRVRLSSPAPRLFVGFVLLVLPALACTTLFPPHPPVDWNAAPNNVVIQASSGGGMLYEPNPMPFARLRGDGQLIWVEGVGTNGGRRVVGAP